VDVSLAGKVLAQHTPLTGHHGSPCVVAAALNAQQQLGAAWS